MVHNGRRGQIHSGGGNMDDQCSPPASPTWVMDIQSVGTCDHPAWKTEGLGCAYGRFSQASSAMWGSSGAWPASVKSCG